MPDHNAQVFNPPIVYRRNRLDHWVEFLCEGFRRWDGIYFMHIAEHGYTYENNLAFFPGFPLIVQLVANTIFYPLQFIMAYANVLLITSIVVNVWVFTKTARILFRLGERVLCDETLAFKAAQLFCINPASIFFSACYSEVLFAFVTFSGMLQVENHQHTKASLFFGLSGLVRSNGVVNCGFILYRKLLDLIGQTKSAVRNNSSDGKALAVSVISVVWLAMWSTLSCIVMCVIPLVLYQVYSYVLFCNPYASYTDLQPHILNYGNSQNYKMAHTGLSKWCHNTPPISYSYVQSYHWNVGFLKYYEFKQTPNFILATPMILLCIGVTIYYAKKNLLHFFSLGLNQEKFYKKYDEEMVGDEADDYGLSSKRCLVYVVHVASLALFGTLFMHVQVS